jgi:hypothetical protein
MRHGAKTVAVAGLPRCVELSTPISLLVAPSGPAASCCDARCRRIRGCRSVALGHNVRIPRRALNSFGSRTLPTDGSNFSLPAARLPSWDGLSARARMNGTERVLRV